METARNKDGTFGKGNKGKPKGAQSRTTKQARELFQEIMSGHVDNVQKALDDVLKESPKSYLDCIAKLAPYFMPKMSEVDLKNSMDSGFKVIIEQVDEGSKSKTNK